MYIQLVASRWRDKICQKQAIISLDKGLSLDRRQFITWTKGNVIGPLQDELIYSNFLQ